MSKEKVKCIIDSNEASQNPSLVSLISNNKSISQWEVKPKDYGDLIFPDSKVVIERKTPSDFAGSMTNGRLKDQLSKMKSVNANAYVLIEGDMKDFGSLTHTRVRSSSLRGYTASIMAREGVPIVFCSTEKNLVDMSIRLARKHVEESTTNFLNKGSVDPKSDPTKMMIGCIPSIGKQTAEILYKEFRTIQGIQNASDDDLEDINGVGPKTVENIRSILG